MLCFVGKLDLSRINCRPSWSSECSHGLPRAALLLQLHGKSGSLSKSPFSRSHRPYAEGMRAPKGNRQNHSRHRGRIQFRLTQKGINNRNYKKKIRKENKSPIR